MAAKRHQTRNHDEADELEPAPKEKPVETASGAHTLDLTIAAGAYLSNAINISGSSIEFVIMPNEWTPAYLTFMGSFDGTNFYDLYDDQNKEVTLSNVNANSMIDVSTKPFKTAYVMFRSGTRNSPKAQEGARTFTAVIV